MKHDWEYKILTDCIEKVKYTNKIQSSDYKKEGLYPIISQEDEYISGYCDNESDLFKISKPIVIFGDHTRIVKYIDFDFVLGADGVKILQPIDNLSAKFFSYFLKSYPIPSLGYSRHFKVIKEISVPVPPLSTQQSIVSELDSLSKIIADCKETLKDYDALEQSIFYDMFGDPVKNEKGWEVKKLSEVTKSTGGGTPSKDVKEYWDGDIVWVSSKDMKTTYISESQLHITKKGVENSSAKMLPIGTILIVNRSGILKHTLPIAITTKELTVNQDIKALIVNDSNIDNIYLLYCLKMFSPYLLSMIKAVTVDSIDFNIIKNLNVPLPPLPLQQQFASKIEAIEQMKVETKKALQEAETLFQARMDYWFN